MLNDYTIRELDTSDLKDAMSLVWKVFLEFEAPEYSQEGVKEFKEYIELEAMKTRVINSELLLWGCYNRENIVGVIAASTPPHINLLFVNKKYHRKGIARALFNKVLDYYINNTKYSEITVNSSPYAHEAYNRLGFADTDPEQTVNGLRFIPMKYTIK